MCCSAPCGAFAYDHASVLRKGHNIYKDKYTMCAHILLLLSRLRRSVNRSTVAFQGSRCVDQICQTIFVEYLS